MSQVYPFDRRNLWGQLNAHNPIYCLKINIKTDYIVGTPSAEYTRHYLIPLDLSPCLTPSYE